jgi:hypothetical protein
MIYNDAYTKTVELIGEHPDQFGKSAALGWGEVRLLSSHPLHPTVNDRGEGGVGNS